MRTKTLLLTAALTAAGALTSMAQVYSVNIVGYMNVNVPKGFSLLANQLNNSPNNTIATLLPTPPNGSVVYKFNGATFASESYDGGLGAWTSGGTTTMNPGEGVFIFAPSAFTATFVGEVQLNSALNIPTGFFIVSSVIPQAGYLHDNGAPGNGHVDLGLVPKGGEVIYQFPNPPSTYSSFVWDSGLGGWGGNPADPGPLLAVGEAFFNFTPPTSGASTWTRSFVVGPP